MWLNVTLHSQSDLYMIIRQLEFALLRLIQQIDQLFGAMQYILCVSSLLCV